MTSNSSNGELAVGHEALVLSLFDLDRLPEDQWPVKHAKPVAPPPPATESMHKRRQVAEQQRAQGRGLSTEEAVEQLSSYMSPSCPFEFQLRRDAVVAATEHANNVARTAARLDAMGYRVVVRNVRDTSVPWSTPAVNSFIVCANREDGIDVEYIIDLQFKEFFRTAYMSATYKSLWHTLPAIFAGVSYRLAGAVQLLSEEVELSFLEEGRPIPPWRSASVAIRRWLSTQYTDQPPPSTPTHPSAATWEALAGPRGASPLFVPPAPAPAPAAPPPLRRRSPLSSLTSGLLANLQTPEARRAPPTQPTARQGPSASSSAASSPTPIRTYPLAPRLPTPTSHPTTSTTPHPIPPRPPSNRPPPPSSSSSFSSPASSTPHHTGAPPSPAHPDAPRSHHSSPRPTPSPRCSHLPPATSLTPRSRGRDCPSPSSPYPKRDPCLSPSTSSTSCSPLRSPPASTHEPTTTSTPMRALPREASAAPAPRVPQPAPLTATPPSAESHTLQDVPTSKSIQDFISFLAHINNQPVPPTPHPTPAPPCTSRPAPRSPSPTPPAAPARAAAPPASAPPATTHLKTEVLSPTRHSKSHPAPATYLTASSTTSALMAPTMTAPAPAPATATIPSHPHHPHPYSSRPPAGGSTPAAAAGALASTSATAAGALASTSTTAAIPIPVSRKSQKMRSLLADAFGRWR